jgi:glycosyltransferase involved in cell wall biosynthesis
MERLAFDGRAPHDPVELGIHVARYAVAAALCRGRRVLDVACGEGYGSWLMRTRWGAASVHGVDVSPAALAVARARFDAPGITWVEMDADRLDAAVLGPPFDLVVSLETVEHVRDPDAFLRTLGSLLAPGGTLVVSCPNDHWYYGPGRSKNPWHRHTFSFEEFRARATAVLGPPAHVLLGSTLGGFANVELAEASSPATLVEALERVRPTDGLALPADAARAPSADACLYWVGVWGRTVPADTSVLVPCAPGHALRVEDLRPRFPRGRERARILLVADVPGWAYDNIAQQIRGHLGDTFDVDVTYVRDYPDHVACAYDLMRREPDLVHVFWREYLFELLTADVAAAVAARHGLPPDDFLARFSAMALTTSVYDHLYLDAESVRRRAPLLWYVDAYSVSSEKLRHAYTGGDLPAPDVVIEDGVDLELFRPPAQDGRTGEGRPLVVGWAGNSEWNRTPTRDPKGLHTVLTPALAALAAEGVPVEGRVIDSAVARVPRTAMPAFYQGLDVYVCVSEIEGTPNPVLEAMACGVPVVSTDVGVVRQVFGPEQQRFVLAERRVEALVALLRDLHRQPALRRRLAAENVARIATWSWAHQMPKWLTLFTIASRRLDARAARRKRHALEVASAAAAQVRDELRRTAAALRGTEALVEERWRIMQHMDGMIAERDGVIAERGRLIAECQARLAKLEGDLRYARSGRGALHHLVEWARGRIGGLVP